ncbi:hypothetical protein SAMN05216436_1053 [bacterium A37T11]|nr:hypothetical protein SAMN05216436_1053 [bacterium A37T11]
MNNNILEQSTSGSEKRASTRTLEADPQYFGVYINMARHNVFQIINALTHKFSKQIENAKPINDDENIANDYLINIGKGTDKSPTIIEVLNPAHPLHRLYGEHVFRALKRYLPLVTIFEVPSINTEDIIKDTDDILPVLFQDLYEFITLLFYELVKFRDAYTHALALDEQGNIVPRKIDLHPNLRHYFEHLFYKAPDYTLRRFRSTQEKIAHGFHEKDFALLKAHNLYQDPHSNELTTQGLFFFTTLFLEQKYAYQFLKRFNGFKNETIQPFKATLRVFTAFTVKLPNDKLASDHPGQSFLLDMLNELNKIPQSLFKHLTPKDQEMFERINDEALTNILKNTDEASFKDVDDLLGKMAPLIRREDRFPYFALWFLEQTKAFNHIRFQISIGKIAYSPYDKTIIGETSPRIIKFDIHGFGSLAEFSDEDTLLTTLKRQLPAGSPHASLTFSQYAPHYHIKNNKIGILVDYPSGDRPLSNITQQPDGKIKVNHIKPTAFISINELPKLVVLALLGTNKDNKPIGNDIERLIRSFITKFKNQLFHLAPLTKIKNGLTFSPETFTRRMDKDKMVKGRIPKSELAKREEYKIYLEKRKAVLQGTTDLKLNVNQLPTKIQNYLLNIDEVSDEKSIHLRIKTMIKEVEYRLKKIDRNKLPKVGDIATYIARDMLDMVADVRTKSRITSAYYSQIQRALAYFALDKTRLIDLCDELGLFNHQTGHVFLIREIFLNNHHILGVYREYLTKKQNWIDQNLIVKIQERGKRLTKYILPTNRPLPYKMKQSINKGFEFNAWLQHKSTMPIDLPTTLFDESLTSLLKKTIAQKLGIASKSEDKFGRLLDRLLKQDTQPFYKFERIYRKPFSQEEPEPFNILKLTHTALKQRFGKPAEVNEKIIRHHQRKDQIVRLMCEHLFKNNSELAFEGEFLLENLHPASRNNPLDAPMVFEQTIPHTHKKIVAQDSNKWIQEVKKTNNRNKAWYRWTLKDFGTFRKIIHDRRLPALVNSITGDEIDFDLVQFELAAYDRARETIFDQLFLLEQFIADKDMSYIKQHKAIERMQDGKGFDEVQFNTYADWLSDKGLLTPDEINGLKEIRNRFSHNQWPGISKLGIQPISQEQQSAFVTHLNIKGWVNEHHTPLAMFMEKLVINWVSKAIT